MNDRRQVLGRSVPRRSARLAARCMTVVATLLVSGCSWVATLDDVPFADDWDTFQDDVYVSSYLLGPGEVQTTFFDAASVGTRGFQVCTTAGDVWLTRTLFGDPLVSSETLFWFGEGDSALTEPVSWLLDGAIVVDEMPPSDAACPGGYVALPGDQASTEGIVYVKFRNPFQTQISVEWWAYASPFFDGGEPGNDSQFGARTLTSDGAYLAGALETVEDLDWFVVGSDVVSADLVVEAPAEGARPGVLDRITFQLRVYDDVGAERFDDRTTFAPGDSFTISSLAAGDRVLVLSDDPTRAAQAFYSAYRVALR